MGNPKSEIANMVTETSRQKFENETESKSTVNSKNDGGE